MIPLPCRTAPRGLILFGQRRGPRLEAAGALARLQSAARSLGAALLEADCAACRQPMGWGRFGVCEACWEEAVPFRGALCALCGRDLPDAEESAGTRAAIDPRRCLLCEGARDPLQAVAAWGPYEGRLRDLIHALKYHDHPRIARPLGGRLAEALDRTGPAPHPAEGALVPVPSTPRREAARGYNQALLLARSLRGGLSSCGRGGPPIVQALRRTRETPAQAGLRRQERLINPRGSIEVARTARPVIEGRTVILVDDVLTTGATARECARVLLRAGAREVRVAAVARAIAS